MLSIAGIFIALEIYLGYIRFQMWCTKKIALLLIGLKLLRSKNKEIRALGWDSIRLVFWESNSSEKSN